jgi:5-methylthioribose kinase
MNIEDPGQLLKYFIRNNWISPGEKVETRILKGGVSNRTVLIKRQPGPDWVAKQAIPKLRVKEDWYCPPERIKSESKGLQWLAKILPENTIPLLIYEDPEEYLLIMQAVPTPHFNLKEKLLKGEIVLDEISQMGKILGTIHREGYENTVISQIFKDSSFFEILRLEPYYRFSANRVDRAKVFLSDLRNQTLKYRYSVVHGDFSPKNILINEGNLRLIDHEVIHFGDATFDLGFALTHFLSKALHLPPFRDDLFDGLRFFIKSYLSEFPPWNSKIEKRAIDHTMGCLLARVHGKSPLEYLSATEQMIQTEIVLELIESTPDQLSTFTDLYYQKLMERLEN